MGSVHKILHAYGLGRKKSEDQKHNKTHAERRIQEIKGTTRTILDCSEAPSWYWLLCMEYAVSILNCMVHRSLSWSTPNKAAHGFTPDAAHLMKFEFWEPIIILDYKT